MRVLLVHNTYRVAGGEERHLDLLERELPRQRVEVERYEVASPERASFPERARIAAGLAYRPSAAKQVRAAAERFGADVVHAHNLTPLLTPAALHGAKQAGAAVVYTAHNYRLVCPAGTMTRGGVAHDECVRSSLLCGLRGGRDSRVESIAYGAAIEIQRRLRLVSRWTDAIVTPSAAVADVLLRAGYPAAKIHVIPYGLERERVPASTPPRYALYAGRLSEEKGLRTLLRAATIANVPLAVAGRGPLTREVELQANGKITYLGELTQDQLRDVRAQAAFVVCPSEWADVLPFAALEALAHGLPVIASRVGGLMEIAKGGGVRSVPPGDAQALAEAMADLWGNQFDRERLAQEASDSACRNYSLAQQTAALVEVYESVGS